MNEESSRPGDRLDSPSTVRNRDAILEVLKEVLPESGTVLEIAAGTGQHATYFAPHFPGLTWQPSDPDPGARRSIAAWTRETGAPVAEPLDIDTASDGWGLAAIDDITAVLAINMIHISPWRSGLGLLRGAARHLEPGGVLYLYGAYRVGGRHTAPSNAEFDAWLKGQNPQWGVRNMDDVAEEALNRGFQMAKTVRMPNNNFSLVFIRKA